jgi:leucyl aminopeptidase
MLVNATFEPSTNPVEFHWYSAEEGGLLGSQAVAQDYARRSIPVRSMIQMDMTAWVKRSTTPIVGIITDFVDPGYTAFLRLIVDEYAQIGWKDTKCGYACSDHASWSKIGAPSAFTIESTFEDSNHKCVFPILAGPGTKTQPVSSIHSGNDRIDYSDEFSFEHMAQVRFSNSASGICE